MKSTSKGLSLTVLGLLVAALGVIAPIAWDWWNKRSQLTIETKSNVSIVTASQPIKNLEFTYGGRKVTELRKLTILVSNTGRTAITKDDVVVPLSLAFAAEEILEASIVRQAPSNLGCSLAIDKNVITLSFALLNQNDEAEIEVLVSGSYAGYSAAARIKNIDDVRIADVSRSITVRRDFGWGVYVAGFFGILFVIAGIAMLAEIPRKKRAVAALDGGNHRLLTAQTRDEAAVLFRANFGFLSGANREGARDEVLNNAWPLDGSAREKLKRLLMAHISREASAGPAFMAFGFACVALWYVFTSVFG